MLGLIGIGTIQYVPSGPYIPPTIVKRESGLRFWDNYNRADSAITANLPISGTAYTVTGGTPTVKNQTWDGVTGASANEVSSSAPITGITFPKDYIVQMGARMKDYSYGFVIRTWHYAPDDTNEIRFGFATVNAVPNLVIKSGGVTELNTFGTTYFSGYPWLARLTVFDAGGGDVEAHLTAIKDPSGGIHHHLLTLAISK